MDFKTIIERIKQKTGYTQKRVATDIFKISDKNLSNMLRRNSVQLEPLINWAVNESVDLNWLLTGAGPPTSESKLKNCTSNKITNVIELQHIELVQGFRDKQRARDIDRELLELERLSPDAFAKVGSYIKGMVDALRLVEHNRTYQGPNRRHGQRRKIYDPSQVPERRDRRSGVERRKTGS